MSLPDRLLNSLKDKLIRTRARSRLYETPFDRFTVSAARSAADYREAFRLVQVAYAWLGIETVTGPTMRISPQHVLPEATVLIARDEAQRMVATMTVTLDSAAGLPLDKDYPEALAALRRPGRRLVEYGSLAVVQRCKRSGVSTLLSMAAHALATNHLGATHVVMGVHPKAAPIYRAVYDFAPLGPPRAHATLEAPVQGMVQDLATVEAFFQRHFPGKTALGRPLCRHYFVDGLPPCITLPPEGDLEQLARWKMPREVFRELFVDSSDRLETLDEETRKQLDHWRSPKTTEVLTGAFRRAQRASRPHRLSGVRVSKGRSPLVA